MEQKTLAFSHETRLDGVAMKNVDERKHIALILCNVRKPKAVEAHPNG
jgi:hypothetical protein